MTPSDHFKIGNRLIGPFDSVYVVAELSANHGQDFDRAVSMIHAAKEAGADAVKIQTYTPDTITLQSEKEHFRIAGGTLWDGAYLYDLYAKAYTPWEWQPKLKKVADQLGIDFFSSAFDESAVDFLEDLEVPAYKIASFELVDRSLIERVARTGKPLILSTGMGTFEEIGEALAWAQKAGAEQIALLKCVSAYPAPPEDMHLQTIPHLADAFGTPVGLSDHTLGIWVPVAAATLGACIIEKHFTLTRSLSTPDAAFSLEPGEFKAMVDAVRTCEKALGRVHYGPTEHELRSRQFRRSLFVVEDMKAGDVLTRQNLKSIRPASGLPPKFYESFLGRRVKCHVPKGTPFFAELLEAAEEEKSFP